MNENWFELNDIEVDFKEFNDFAELEKKLKKASLVRTDDWNLSYVKIGAKLIFKGKLNTPSGEVETEFVYYIKSKLSEFLKEAKIEIYEQTFTGLDLAVTVKFSSGSIISKIVFGDIEKAYTQLKKAVLEKVKEHNEEAKKFNIKIEDLQKKQESKEDEE